MKRIAIQGFSGCFHEQAARKFYSEPIEIVECATFEGLFVAMEEGRADAAIMAVENTTSGGLLPNYELLRKRGKKIKGEVFLRIEQNLMALPGQKLEDIREVHTHYMAFNQTREFFKKHPEMRLVESEDTALSAAEVAKNQLKGVAAVASSLAAELYGLEIICPGIETYKQNFTRFLIIDDSIEVPVEKANKATLCFTLPHQPGSLAHVLTIMSFYGMNLTKIQSLPLPGREWQYFFYIEIKHEDHLRFEQAIAAVRPLMEDLTIMGEYSATI